MAKRGLAGPALTTTTPPGKLLGQQAQGQDLVGLDVAVQTLVLHLQLLLVLLEQIGAPRTRKGKAGRQRELASPALAFVERS